MTSHEPDKSSKIAVPRRNYANPERRIVCNTPHQPQGKAHLPYGRIF